MQLTRLFMVETRARCDSCSMQSTPVSSDLAASWQYTLAHWTERSAHDTLLGLAAKHQQLAWLATRYRESARTNPRDPIARDRLKGVQRAAALLAFATPAVRETRPKRMRGAGALLLASALFTGLGLWLTDLVRDQHQATMVSRHP